MSTDFKCFKKHSVQSKLIGCTVQCEKCKQESTLDDLVNLYAAQCEKVTDLNEKVIKDYDKYNQQFFDAVKERERIKSKIMRYESS